MSMKKPLSKTQGGSWWVIRRPNGSVMINILERFNKVADALIEKEAKK